MARRGNMVITAALTQTTREDTWPGIRIRVVYPAAGEIASNWYGFSEHDVFDESHLPQHLRSGELDRYNHQGLLRVDRICADRLREAVSVYTALFAPPPGPAFAAAARLNGLWRLARCLDHLGSTDPTVLAGRTSAHSEVLREVAEEIYPDLSAISGDRKAADSGPITVEGGLENLRKLRTSLTELSVRLDQSGEVEQAAAFHQHVEALGGIDAEITADLAGPSTARSSAEVRVAAARSMPSAATAVGPAPSDAADVPSLHGSAPARGDGRGQR